MVAWGEGGGFRWEAEPCGAKQVLGSAPPAALNGAPSLYDADQDANDRKNKQQVNEPTQGVVRDHSDQPHQEKQNRDRPEHVGPPRFLVVARSRNAP